MKDLIWKLVLPLTIISFAVFTKWWYVLPVDGPDTMMTGFPLPYVCPGWHTSLSLQIFLTEFIIDFLLYFLFWFVTVYAVNRYLVRVKLQRILALSTLTIFGIIVVWTMIIASGPNNIFEIKRPWDLEVLTTGYKFVWQHQERPDYNDYKYESNKN